MSDMISRQAAIRWVKTECNPYGKPTLDFESGKKVIEHLEQSHWTPCGERLPYRFGKVLCTFIPSGGNLWTTVIIAHYSDLMGIAKPCFWVGEVGKNSFTNITEQVKAWMPLPEPYLVKEVKD